MTRQELLKVAEAYKEKIAIYQENTKENVKAVMLPAGATQRAYEVILELAEKGEMDITEVLLKKLHALCNETTISDNDKDYEGYRTINIQPEWTKYTPPAPEELEHLMSHFIGQMQISRQMFHPIEFAAICHKRVMEICPFKEGNEEVAMLLMNLILVHHGYEMITSFKAQEENYLSTLEAAQHPSHPDIDRFITFIAQCVVKIEEEKCKQLYRAYQ